MEGYYGAVGLTTLSAGNRKRAFPNRWWASLDHQGGGPNLGHWRYCQTGVFPITELQSWTAEWIAFALKKGGLKAPWQDAYLASVQKVAFSAIRQSLPSQNSSYFDRISSHLNPLLQILPSGTAEKFVPASRCLLFKYWKAAFVLCLGRKQSVVSGSIDPRWCFLITRVPTGRSIAKCLIVFGDHKEMAICSLKECIISL